MNIMHGRLRRVLCCGTATIALLLAAPAAQAQGNGDSATVKLIQLLIQKGILTSGQAASLLNQAQQESGAPRSRHARTPIHPAPAQTQTDADETPSPPKGEVRVTYVPQFVRDQIAGQVRAQLLDEVKNEGWASPHAVPSWIDRVTVYGDLRLRYQGDYENGRNAQANGQPYLFPNFNAINAGSGYDQTFGSGLPPLVNVTENRDRYRLRARVGVRAQIADWVSSDIRLATGNDNSPISENQTLGSPGDFSKYAVYVDRAYVTLTPLPGLRIYAGREPNPYFVSDLMYAPDLNFDGVSAQYVQNVTPGLALFLNGGLHPVFNTDLNFSSTSSIKNGSHDAYLLAAQAGATWTPSHDYVLKAAAGYFAYSNITGEESSPCLLVTSADTCSTDDTRPAFLQFGNTVFPIRDIVTNSSSLAAQPQYYGLASHFGILDLHGRLDLHNYDPVVISLEGEFIKNLAYNRSYILSRNPANNLGVSSAYVGGDTGYMAKLTVGNPQIDRLWDWNVSFAYKYLQTDAAVDAFTDPDFHLGGTNAKGYVVGGNLGLADKTSVTVRWLGANQVSGPDYGNDVLQIDLNTAF